MFLYSCASTSVTSVPVKKLNTTLSSILVICIQEPGSIGRFNEENYNRYIRKEFNHIDNREATENLEVLLKRTMMTNGFPRIVGANEVFESNLDYSYQSFKDIMNKSGCQSVLLINTTDLWQSAKITTSHQNNISITEYAGEQNSNNFVYLYDLINSTEYIWLGKIDVRGFYSGYKTLNNHLARKISRILIKEGYVQ